MPTDSSSSAKPGSQPPAARQPPLTQPPFRYAPPQQLPYPIPGAVPIIPRQPLPPTTAQPAPAYYPPFQTPPSYPGPVQQPYTINGYVYQAPQYPYHMPNAPPQSMLNPRPPQSSFRPPATPQPVQKSILKIVDPETNEEVKIDQQAVPAPQPPPGPNHQPVKIPPKHSKALELVPDPADVPKLSPASENKIADTKQQPPPKTSLTNALGSDQHQASEKEPLPSESKPSLQAHSDEHSEPATDTCNNSSNLALVTASPQSQPIATEARTDDNKEKSHPSTPIDTTPIIKPTPSTPVEIEIMTSDVSSTTIIDAQQDEKDLPLLQVEPETKFGLPNHTLAKSGVEETLHLESMQPVEAKSSEKPNLATKQAPQRSESKAQPESLPDLSEGKQKLEAEQKLGAKQEPEAKQQPEAKEEPEAKQKPVAKQEPKAKQEAEAKQKVEAKREAEAVQKVDAKQEAEAVQKPLAKHKPEAEPNNVTVTKTVEEGEAEEINGPSINDDNASESEILSSGSSPPRRARTSFLTNGRLIYPPSFMWAVRSNVPARKATDYDDSLRSGGRDIFKGDSTTRGRSDQRSQLGRNAGPLSSDPRGSRTYPTPGSAPFSMPPGSGPGGRTFAEFDLGIARSQAPPPPRGQSSSRDGDPRGSRQQPARGRYDQSRHSGPDPFIHRGPAEKLKRTENGWKRNKEADDEITAKVKQVRALLNKLTLEKFDKIFKQIVDIDISSYIMLDSVVKEVFEKTLFEPEFSGMYAELCRRLESVISEPLSRANVLDPDGKPISFKKILVNNCRDEFTRFAEAAESKDEDSEGGGEPGDGSSEVKKKKELTAQEKEEVNLTAIRAKRRMLANVRFIGELYLKDLLKESVIHRQCIQRLLKRGIKKKEEDILEALCKLVSKTGAKISTNPDAAAFINQYFSRFDSLGRDHTLPARIRFMIQDLIEQRRNGWKVRRQKKGAKTIAEIHKEAKDEERKKMEAQQAVRDRRHRGGMGGRDRAPQGFVPRMTMPSGPRQGSTQSRLDRTLEKQPSRPISGISSGFAPVSLRPGSSSRGSLRPGGSSFGSFGVLAPDKDTSANGQAAETRRGKMGGWQPASRRTQPSVPKPASPKPELMDPKILKRKAKGTMEEFWANPLITEVKEILAEEVKAPNFKSFVHEALMATFSAKVAHQIQSIDLFAGLVDAPIPGEVFCQTFSKLIGSISDMEIDNPRAGEFLGRIIGATAATRKLDQTDTKYFGLGFLAKDIQAIEDPKRRANFAIFTFAELRKRLTSSIPGEEERENVIRQVVDRIHVDLAADMSAWNSERGLDKLSDMLKDNKVPFLVPYLDTEKRLKDLLKEKESAKKVEELLRSASEVANSNLMRMVVRVGFNTLFMEFTNNVVEIFKTCIGIPVVNCFSTLPMDVQFSTLLATQAFIGRSQSLLPPLPISSEKHGEVAFEALFKSNLVESEVFTKWLQDKTETERVTCKKEMVEQTQRFFERLPKAKK
ncbi:unnamed protein product [Agarophyton chilense]|eukprot:gb/GEZJ01002246.1/.p1 GENE.gb/GEZJ01002246.1/~~gb/GEZJ01002246.1/.p1  ORF type:complete len:1495 (-),score=264.03 gb/GEZJ01002246.1/:359-4801(-)